MSDYISTDMVNYYLDQARAFSLRSLDPSVKTGAVIVKNAAVIVGFGWNQMPAGLNADDPARWERPLKCDFVEHAERFAIYNAARQGVKTEGCSMFATDPPCIDCARAIIQSGITSLYYPKEHSFLLRLNSGLYGIKDALAMMTEANVHVEERS